MNADFVVMSSVTSAGERFFIFRPSQIPPGGPYPSSAEELQRVWRQYQESAAVLTEDRLRAELSKMGLSGDEADSHIDRARRIRDATEQTVITRITTIGYRNIEGQEVLRKTDLTGALPGQRVFVMRCGGCGHEYGSHGCDIDRRRCPNCQGGEPGLPTSGVLG